MSGILFADGGGLKHKVFMSPMAGCSDLAFRRIARRFGCPVAFTEMVKDRPVVEGNARTLEMLRTAEWDRPLGMQLVGNEPGRLAEAAKRLEGMGADLVDLNLGCPVPKVVKCGCGAALLGEPGLVGRLVEAMVRAVGIPVTVKMRSGPGADLFLETARAAEEAGAAAITVHGRTPGQMYRGSVSLEAIRAVKESVKVPVIGNGDIRTGADAKRMRDATGCDGVMVARGALGNPWIFRDIECSPEGGGPPPPPSVAERAEVLREHFRLLRELYGDRMSCHVVRRVIHWYVKGLPGAAALRERGNHVESPAQFDELAAAFAAGDQSVSRGL